MSLCKNTILKSEISSVPIKLKYSQDYSCGGEDGIRFVRGYNGTVDYSGSVNQAILFYREIRQLYYLGNLSGSVLNSSSFWNNNVQSTAASGTYEYENRYFPTESGAEISVMFVPREVFGEKISPNSFYYSNELATLTDDGNGNVVNVRNNNEYAGNIIYSQGIVVLTNQNYQNVFPKSPVLTDYYGSFYDNVTPKKFNIIRSLDTPGQGDYNYSTLNFFGTEQSHLFSANPSTGEVTVAAVDPGTYTTYYNIKNQYGSGCGLISNNAKCTITVNKYVYEYLAGIANENDCRISGSVYYNDCAFSGIAYVVPDPSPSITPTITVTISTTKTPTPTKTPTRTPTTTPTISTTPSITPTISDTPAASTTPSITITPFLSQTATPSVTATPLPTISITPTTTPTATISVTISLTPTVTPTISVTSANNWILTGNFTATPNDRYVNLKYRNRVGANPNGGFITLASQIVPGGGTITGNAANSAISDAEVYVEVQSTTLIASITITDNGGTRTGIVGSGASSITFSSVNGNFTVSYVTKVNCVRYQNASYTDDIYVTYINCSGVTVSAQLVRPRDTFCAIFGKVLSYTGQGFPSPLNQAC